MKRSVPVQSPSQYFSRLFFTLFSLLSCFTFLSSLQNREWGAPSPGPHHSLPVVPKEAEPNTKTAVIAILHSPPPLWKPHFNLKCSPSPPHPSPPPCGQGRVTVGHHGTPPVGGAMFLPQRLSGCETWAHTMSGIMNSKKSLTVTKSSRIQLLRKCALDVIKTEKIPMSHESRQTSLQRITSWNTLTDWDNNKIICDICTESINETMLSFILASNSLTTFGWFVTLSG